MGLLHRALLAFAVFLPVVGAACAAPVDEGAESAAAEFGEPRFALRVDVEAKTQAAMGEASDAERERASLHLGNAYWLARLADYAYWPPTVIRQQLNDMRINVRDFRFFSDSCTGAQAVYLATPDAAVLAFRGSDAIAEDWIRTNGNAAKVGWDGPGRVHAGFATQFESLWRGARCDAGAEGGALGTFVADRHGWSPSGERRGPPLYVVGHSLGGALATLFLARVQHEGCRGTWFGCDRRPTIPVSALYTYASPKTGDETFATTVADRSRGHTPIFRIVYGDDPVTFFPRNLLPELLGDYRHVGYWGWQGESSMQVFIRAPGELRVAEQVVRGPWQFHDHGLPPYIETLRALARSRNAL